MIIRKQFSIYSTIALALAATTAVGVFAFGPGKAHAQVPPPSCHIWVSPSTIQAGQDFTFNWDCQNATNGWSNELGVFIDTPSGSVTVSGADQSMTISATFNGPGGQTTCYTDLVVEQPAPVPTPSNTNVNTTNNNTNTNTNTNVNNININTNTPPAPAAPTCTLSVNPTSLQSGQQTVLTWSSANATAGTISGIGSVAPSGSMAAWPPQTQTYTGTFTGPGGSVTCTATVTVVSLPPPPPALNCTISISPSSVRQGERAVLSWSSAGATSGTITGLGSVPASGSERIYPDSSRSYTATFYGANGQSVNCYASVNVIPVTPVYNAPQCTLTANTNVVNPGQPAVLSWTSHNATAGTVSTLGSVPPYGSQTIYPAQSQTYEGTFTGPGGSVNCFATVNVNPVYNPPYIPPAQPPYIQLSQAPYTGLDLGPWGTAAYWAFLALWCALAAYLVGVKKVQNKLVDYVMSGIYGRKSLTPAHAAASAGAQPQSSGGFDKPAFSAPQSDITDSFVLSQIDRA